MMVQAVVLLFLCRDVRLIVIGVLTPKELVIVLFYCIIVKKCRLDSNCVADCSFDAIEIVNNQLLINRNFCKDCNDYACIKIVIPKH